MILVDANVWIAHLDHGDPVLSDLLLGRKALVHPFTIGEVALGPIVDREEVLLELERLPGIVVARHDEVMRMIEVHSISRIGYVDAHLLASLLLAPDVALWTRDKRLRREAERLGVLALLA